MMEAAARKIAVSADHLRQSARGNKDALALLAPFGEMLAEKVAAALTALAGVPVKASVEQSTIQHLAPLQQAEPGFDVSSPQGAMALWFQADRVFDVMLCELCLGGAGDARTSEEQDRPPTAFERRLRNLAMEKMASAAAATFAEITEQPEMAARPRARVAVRKIEASLACHALKLLINAFEAACEVTFHLALADCLKLAGAAPVPGDAQAAGQLLDSTPFSLEVFLKPDTVDVRHILGLTEGGVLKLNVAASSPVELKFNGQRIGLGLMGHDGERVRVRLIDGGASHGEPPTVRNLLKLVNERVADF